MEELKYREQKRNNDRKQNLKNGEKTRNVENKTEKSGIF